ncbi:MAG: hypothetical protein AB7R40_22260 [Nitrospiraceae bacterium]
MSEVGFTAPVEAPGQAESREAKPLFEAWLAGLGKPTGGATDGENETNALERRFAEEFRLLYEELLNEREPVLDEAEQPMLDKHGRPKTRLVRDWRKAAYEAWSSLPASLRRPKTLTELADQLGLRNTATIRHWRRKDPQLETRFKERLTGRLLEYAPDVMMALVAVAADADPKAHQDRKLYLEMTGLYKPKQTIEATGAEGEPLIPAPPQDLSKLSVDELRQLREMVGRVAATA